uniref:TNFR-Cys domain-containing protein n=1 Tax=Eptatretus burgeri TaxID=7764 RepID=A0A8C4PZ65_EPTBU
MDGARRSGVLAIVTLFFVEVSLMSSRPSIIQDDLSGKPDICDPESEYKATKHCCQLCPPGFYLGEECHEPGQESACYPCHINFFMAFKNHARKCHRCKECFGDFEEKAACMPTMNRECRCISGKYQDHDGEICINCTPCTNQNTLQECTESTDTICINADDDQRFHHGNCGVFASDHRVVAGQIFADTVKKVEHWNFLQKTERLVLEQRTNRRVDRTVWCRTLKLRQFPSNIPGLFPNQET